MKRITIEEVDGILHVRLGKFLLKMKPHANVNNFFKLTEVHNAIRTTLYSPKGKQWKDIGPAQWYRVAEPSIRVKKFLAHIHVEGEPYPIEAFSRGSYRGVYGTPLVVERYIQWINESRVHVGCGKLYVFYIKRHGMCKIGYGRKINALQKSLGLASGVEPTLVYTSDLTANAYDVEQLARIDIDKRFKKLLGGWFEVKEGDTDDVVKMVKSANEEIGIKGDEFNLKK
jgi:hypothetical protein